MCHTRTPKTKLIRRAISTQASGNLPYHVKTICSYQQKSIKKKEQFHPENAGNGICEALCQNFPLPYDARGYVARRADERPPPFPNFLARTPIPCADEELQNLHV